MKPLPTTASSVTAANASPETPAASGAPAAAGGADSFQHYKVLRREDGSLWELGRGAMGVTYKAFDTNLRCHVALKVISAHYLESVTATQRFIREAQIAARLRHPNIAAVYHLGTDPQSFFYAMEFIEGETLENLVERSGPLPLETVLRIGLQASRALSAASRLGLIHRDIKPANLMVTEEGDEGEDRMVVKMIDFGLARSYAADDTQPKVTHSGFVGTPIYASPEQLEEHDLDVRSDIYSLGITLWVLLAGQPPFVGKMTQVITQHLNTPPPWWQLGQCSEPVRDLFEHMLKKDRAERYQSAGELRAALEKCQQSVTGKDAAPPVAAMTGDSTVQPLPTPSIAPAPGWQPAADAIPLSPTVAAGPRTGQWRLPLLGVAAALVLGVVGFVFWLRSSGNSPGAKSSANGASKAVSGAAAASIHKASARAAAESTVVSRAETSPALPEPPRGEASPPADEQIPQPLENTAVTMGAATPPATDLANNPSPAPEPPVSPAPAATPGPGTEQDEADADTPDASGRIKPGAAHGTHTHHHATPTPAPNFFQRLFGIKPKPKPKSN